MTSSTMTTEETTEGSTSTGEGSDSGSSSSDGTSSSSGGVTYAHTLYLNFEGVTLTLAAEDDATNDEVMLESAVGAFEPFGPSPQPAAILDLVAEDFAPFDVLVTDERPSEGPYAMAVISPTNPINPNTLTIATEVDCDNETESNIVFVFADAESGYTNQELANFISSVFGHSFGLDNGAPGTGDLMENGSILSDDREFVDACLDLQIPPGGCGQQHAKECGPTGQQNTYAELLAHLGVNPN